jgi:hypothetical protein
MTIRGIKLAAIAVLAAAALGALTASAAQAEPRFTASEYAAVVEGTGSNTHTFSLSGKKVTCESTSFLGILASASKALNLVPTYSKCDALFLGVTFPATVKMNECDFSLVAEGVSPTYFAAPLIFCPEGKSISILVYESAAAHTEGKPICTYTIGIQLPNGVVVTLNEGSGKTADLTTEWSIEGIAVTVDGSKALCGTNGNTGTYTGKATLKGTNAKGESVGVSIDG